MKFTLENHDFDSYGIYKNEEICFPGDVEIINVGHDKISFLGDVQISGNLKCNAQLLQIGGSLEVTGDLDINFGIISDDLNVLGHTKFKTLSISGKGLLRSAEGDSLSIKGALHISVSLKLSSALFCYSLIAIIGRDIELFGKKLSEVTPFAVIDQVSSDIPYIDSFENIKPTRLFIAFPKNSNTPIIYDCEMNTGDKLKTIYGKSMDSIEQYATLQLNNK